MSYTKTMFFYEVAPASPKFLGKSSLIYKARQKLDRGQIVQVKFRSTSCSGLIVGKVGKPDFPSQPIEKIYSGLSLPPASLKLFDWMRQYYPGPLGPSASLFLPAQISGKSATVKKKDVNKKTKSPVEPLTDEQASVLDRFNKERQSRAFLLHGVTGSGKTRVYLEIARKNIKDNKSVIILTPEISLTPQLVNYFEKNLEAEVIVTHSGMSRTQRREAWIECLNHNSPKVVIGPRSAIFMPIKNLGSIIIDEMHDGSYTQAQAPAYNALRVAGFVAKELDCKLIMGSATPTVSEYYLAKKLGWTILKMNKSAKPLASPVETALVDLAKDSERTTDPLLSRTLIKHIGDTLSGNHQVLIFLNRRGSFRSIICGSCGWQARCNRCDLALTYHVNEYKLICHTCGQSYPVITSCPDCGSVDVVFKSPGTKSIAAKLSKIFPDANVARFDSDNKKIESFSSRHGEIVRGEIDIMVGTQILIKGHDLPRLGLAAMLCAESSLNFPDYTAEEQTYQIFNQLGGRIGRGHVPGKLLIQSYNPEMIRFLDLSGRNYTNFYNEIIHQRKKFGFPPYYYYLKIFAMRASHKTSKTAINKLFDDIKTRLPEHNIFGPMPSFKVKTSGKYTWQLLVRSKNRSELVEIAKNIPNGYRFQIDPPSLL